MRRTHAVTATLACVALFGTGCTNPSLAIKKLCVATNEAGKNLAEANRLLSKSYLEQTQAIWAIKCQQKDDYERSACEHAVIDAMRAQYVERYDAATRVTIAQNILAESLEKGACKP